MGKILIIGHFGGDKPFLDGQTVKTKILYKELSVRLDDEIICVDTYLNKVNKIKLIFLAIWGILRCNKIILLVSGNGMRVFFPLLYFSSKFLGKKIFHDVIGGNLDIYIKKNPYYAKYLNSFKENWVEYNAMKNRLEELGINNCRVLPNFKKLDTSMVRHKLLEQYKKSLCMFSRVMPEKGIKLAIDAISAYNEYNSNPFTLDIWGPIDESFKEEFESLLRMHTFVNYCGCVDYKESTKYLTNHIALLFPTYWDGEGFPGTIIDAYAAGIPVVASDWNANKELIDNFRTGLVYPNEEVKTLQDSLSWIANNFEKMDMMRANCISEYYNYCPDRIMVDIINILNLKSKC